MRKTCRNRKFFSRDEKNLQIGARTTALRVSAVLILLVNVSERLIGDKMYPNYECNNYPMNITDDDGPFLIMEAELSGDVELKMSLRKTPAIDIRVRLFLRRSIFASQ